MHFMQLFLDLNIILYFNIFAPVLCLVLHKVLYQLHFMRVNLYQVIFALRISF